MSKENSLGFQSLPINPRWKVDYYSDVEDLKDPLELTLDENEAKEREEQSKDVNRFEIRV